MVLAILGVSPLLCGCLVLTPAAQASATAAEWPQAVHDVRWSGDWRKLTVVYTAYRQAPWGDWPCVRRDLALEGMDLWTARMDVETMPAVFPGGGISAEAMRLQSRMARCVVQSVNDYTFALDRSEAYRYFRDWRSYEDVTARLARGQPVVLRPGDVAGNEQNLYSRVVVFVPGEMGKVYAIPLPDRERSRAWYYLCAPVLFVADVILQPVWGVAWVVNKLSFADRVERHQEPLLLR